MVTATPEIKTSRYWSSSDVRELCIGMKWYTRGNNKEYESILYFVDNSSPTTTNMYIVAKDIYDHSDTECMIEDIMYYLEKYCVGTVFVIEEDIA